MVYVYSHVYYDSAMNKYPQYHTNPDDIHMAIHRGELVHHAAVDANYITPLTVTTRYSMSWNSFERLTV
jgi:hypothetical protein